MGGWATWDGQQPGREPGRFGRLGPRRNFEHLVVPTESQKAVCMVDWNLIE